MGGGGKSGRSKINYVSPGRYSVCGGCCSVPQSCPTLCDPMDCSTPGFPVHHQLPELAHIHQVSDAIQPSHTLSSPSPTEDEIPFTRIPFFSTPFPILVSCLFGDRSSDISEVLSHCGFDLHFLDD